MQNSVEEPVFPRSECSVEVNELFSLVYGELKGLANLHMMSEREDHSLSPTALLHEAYVRLAGSDEAALPMTRIHFFAAAAEAMRHLLIEHARKHNRRSQILRREFFSSAESKGLVLDVTTDLIELDDAIGHLARLHPEKADLMKLRYFGGLTLAEAAEALGVSLATANRHWAYARAWLSRELMGPD